MDAIEDRLLTLGMKPIQGQYQPLSADEIRQLEELMGGELPHDYRAFISRYGCAYFPGKTLAIRPLSAPPPRITATGLLEISVLFGGGTTKYPILRYTQAVRGRMPASMFPIVDDDSANEFCLVVVPEQHGTAGEIYFWSSGHDLDREDFESKGLPVPDDYLWHNLTLVARSFTDFVFRLEEVKE